MTEFKRRRFAVVDIKLLRLGLVGRETGPIDGAGISADWAQAQPTENLSPFSAGVALSVAPWSRASRVEERYRKLMLRFPPEQCAAQHLEWRPAVELLGHPVNRLNWYWQSGQVPDVEILESIEGVDHEFGKTRIRGGLSLLNEALARFEWE